MQSIINNTTLYMPILLSIYYIYKYAKQSYSRRIDFLSYFLILTLPMIYMNTSTSFYYRIGNIEIVLVVVKSILDFLRGKIRIVISDALKWFVLFFLVIFMLGLAGGIDREFYSGIRNMACFSLSIMFAYQNINKNLEMMYNPMLLNLMVTSCLSIFEVIAYYVIHHSFILRPMGFAHNANYNCFFILYMLLFLQHIAKKDKKKLYFVSAIALLAALGTQSSAGIIGIAICLISERKLGKKAVKLLVLGAFILVFTLVVVRVTNYDMYLNLFPSEGDRMVLWSVWIKGFKEHPLFGFGYNKFAIRYADYIEGETAISAKAIKALQVYSGQNANYPIPERLASHNDLIKLLTETGIVGIILFCIFIYKVMKESAKISASILKMIAVTLIFFMTNNPLNTPLFYLGVFSIILLKKEDNKNGYQVIWSSNSRMPMRYQPKEQYMQQL